MLFIVNVWNNDTRIHCDFKFYVLHLVNIFNIAAIAQLTMLYTALFHAITLYRVTSLVSSSMLVARRKCLYSLFNQSLRMLRWLMPSFIVHCIQTISIFFNSATNQRVSLYFCNLCSIQWIRCTVSGFYSD